MTTTLALDSRYADVLQALGNVDIILQEAARSYAIERLGEKIGTLQHEILTFQKKYGLPYEEFYAQITTNEDFVRQLRQTHPTWERDFNHWEYSMKERQEWLTHLSIFH